MGAGLDLSAHRAVPQRSWIARWIGLLSLGFTLLLAILLLRSAYGMLTLLKLQVNDYGTYTNFLWNSAHGRPFLCFVDQNYLRTHLSFTLLLIAPLFRVWDNPFLLMVVQWLCPLLGALIVWRVSTRLRFEPPLPAVFVLLYFAYPYTQSVLSCDFHGVCLYLLLLPWLYYCLALRREMVVLPWLLILGLREDAAFVMLPMLLYFAVKDRWRTGYILAGLAAAYSLAAMLWIYPQINEITLAERRATELDVDSMANSWGMAGLRRRAEALFWLVLPALPLLRKRWLPILVFPSVALIMLQASPEPRVQLLGVHYPAAVYPLLVMGMIEALALGIRQGESPGPNRAIRLGLLLVGLAVFAHFTMGRFPEERRTHARRWSLQPSRSGQNALWAAQHIPKEGVLLTDRALAGICGNRADMLAGLHNRSNAAYRVDLFFADAANRDSQAVLRELLAGGDFGVIYFDQRYAIVQRGAGPARNGELVLALDNAERTVVFARTDRQAGKMVFAPGCDTARYWKGDGTHANVELTLGGLKSLAPGRYEAIFRLRAEVPKRTAQGSWGRLSVLRNGASSPLAKVEIDPVAGALGEFRYQTLAFSLPEEATVEPRVQGGDAPLWLDRVMFVKSAEDGK